MHRPSPAPNAADARAGDSRAVLAVTLPRDRDSVAVGALVQLAARAARDRLRDRDRMPALKHAVTQPRRCLGVLACFSRARATAGPPARSPLRTKRAARAACVLLRLSILSG